MLERDLELVTHALGVVHDKGYEPDLPVEVKRGKKLKKELELLERVFFFFYPPRYIHRKHPSCLAYSLCLLIIHDL